MKLAPGLIFELARQAQVEIPEHGSKRRCRCPFHEDRHASAFLSENNVFFCSVCTPEGGWPAKRFAQELGLPWPPTWWRPPQPPLRKAKGGVTLTFGAADAHDVWRKACGRARDDDAVAADRKVYDYVAARGIAAAWECPGFGVLGTGMELPSTISWWPSSDYRLVVPLFDLHGAIANVQARSLDPGAAVKTIFPKGSRARGTVMANDAGLRLLRGEHQPANHVILGEGLTDFLALGIATSMPVLSAPGTSMLAQSVGPWARGREVFVASDVDEAGDRCLDATARALFRAGATRVFSVTWPDGCSDACETIVTIGPDGLTSFLDEITARRVS